MNESTRQESGDPALIAAARTGDKRAFDTLRLRHQDAALRLARILVTSGVNPSSVVDDAFAAVRATMTSGGGPDTAFRIQLLGAVKNAASANSNPSSSTARTTADVVAPSSSQQDADPGQPRDNLADPIIRKGFLALPERWGSVVWHTAVEGQPHSEVAHLLGMTEASVDSLDSRARDGLVRGYLAGQVHQLDNPECNDVLQQLQAYSRQELDPATSDVVRHHLDGCDDCRRVADTLVTMRVDLGAVLAPVLLGSAAGRYLDGGAHRPAAAMAAPGATRRTGRSFRLALVAAALTAVVVAVPALRAGAGDRPADATAKITADLVGDAATAPTTVSSGEPVSTVPDANPRLPGTTVEPNQGGAAGPQTKSPRPTATTAQQPAATTRAPDTTSTTTDTATSTSHHSDTSPSTSTSSSDTPPADGADIQPLPLLTPWLITATREVPVSSTINLMNTTGTAVGAQQLTVVVPPDVELLVSGAAGGCQVQLDAVTYVCVTDPMDESRDVPHQVRITLTAAADAQNGSIIASVTGNRITGSFVTIL